MDVQEFQRFYEEKFRLIYRYVYSNIGNREVAEDLTSEIFLKAVSSIDQERGPYSMQKWLYLIARTTVANYWRAHYRAPTSSLDALLEAGWEGPVEEEPTAISSEPAERVRSLLQLNEVCVPEIVVCPRKLWIDRNGFIKLANGELQEAGLAIGAAEKHMQRSRRALKRQNTIE